MRTEDEPDVRTEEDLALACPAVLLRSERGGGGGGRGCGCAARGRGWGGSGGSE